MQKRKNKKRRTTELSDCLIIILMIQTHKPDGVSGGGAQNVDGTLKKITI